MSKIEIASINKKGDIKIYIIPTRVCEYYNDPNYYEEENYNIYDLIRDNKELKEQNKLLRNEMKVHSEKSNNRYKAIKDLENHILKLNLECQKYFDLLMTADEENKQLKEQVNNKLTPNELVNMLNQELLNQLKQRDEVIEELENHCELMLKIFEKMDEQQRDKELDKFKTYDYILRILQKYKGDNNE